MSQFTTSANITFENQVSPDAPFRRVNPAPDYLNVVKVTKDNLQTVARSLTTKGGGTVSIHSGYFILRSTTFTVGDFVVKEYDHVHGTDVIRHATLEERIKYDLR